MPEDLVYRKKMLYQHFENKTDVVYKVAHFEFEKKFKDLVNWVNKTFNPNFIKETVTKTLALQS